MCDDLKKIKKKKRNFYSVKVRDPVAVSESEHCTWHFQELEDACSFKKIELKKKDNIT